MLTLAAATEPRPPKYPGWVRAALLITLIIITWGTILSPFYLKGN